MRIKSSINGDIRQKIIDSELTQNDVAYVMGISYSTLQSWLRDRSGTHREEIVAGIKKASKQFKNE